MTGLRSNPDLAGYKLAKNRLNHGMVPEMRPLRTENAPPENKYIRVEKKLFHKLERTIGSDFYNRFYPARRIVGKEVNREKMKNRFV